MWGLPKTTAKTDPIYSASPARRVTRHVGDTQKPLRAPVDGYLSVSLHGFVKHPWRGLSRRSHFSMQKLWREAVRGRRLDRNTAFSLNTHGSPSSIWRKALPVNS